MIRYATGSGVSLAWDVTGAGPPLVLVCDGFISLEDMEEEPRFARSLARLASFTTLLRFDRRGVGLSDPPPDGAVSLDDWVADVVAVLDAAGVERAWLLGAVETAGLAARVAAQRPDRVLGLVLVNGSARALEAPDYPVGFPAEVVDGLLEARLAEDGGDEDSGWLSLVAPSAAGDPAFRRWWERAGRRGASPAVARRSLELVFRSDVRADVARVAVPALVLHRRDTQLVPAAHGRWLAEHLPGAEHVELDGADLLWWVGGDDLLDEVERFVAGAVVPDRDERVVRTLLMTDVVGSTEALARLGDAAWTALLDRHDLLVRRALRRHAGTEVQFTGDGVLALFVAPGDAVACAREVQQGVHELGLSVRAGVHTGPVARRSSDVAGLVVHVTARICARAGADELLCSQPVVAELDGTWSAHPAGTHVLKGVPGDWPLWRVEPA